jgi:alpha-galactosidase
VPSLKNQYFDFELDPEKASWGLLPTKSQAVVRSMLPSITYLDGSKINEIKLDISAEFSTATQLIEGLGLCQIWSATSTGKDEVGITVEFALPEDTPLLLIRATLINKSDRRIQQRQFCLINSTEMIFSGEKDKFADLGCVVNGWQSWSYSGVYSSNQKAVISHLGAFQVPKLYDSATPIVSKKGLYTSDFYGAVLDRTHRIGWLVGYLSQCEHFGHMEFATSSEVQAKALAAGDDALVLPETSVISDWLAVSLLDLNSPDPLAEYMETCARVNQVQIRSEVPNGWCSWYHYFTKINPNLIRFNLDHLSEVKEELPVGLVQIDDGFEKNIGDWLETKPVFGGEMGLLADEIRETGKTPGLWLAPFIVSPASDLYKNHPEWLIRDEKGKPASAGWNWNRFCTGLDLTHPGAQEYIRQVIKTAVDDWGYGFLKLDFLYAAALTGKRYNPTHTRAKVLRKAMELIREAAGNDTYLLGCGAPLGPCVGLVDGMRIGTDTAPDWEPKYMGIEMLFPNDPDIPSAKNALQNTLSRSAMHNRWWHNDPDCLLLRPSSNLILAEVQTYASVVALTGGLMLISDDMSEVSQYRLKIAQAMMPGINQRPAIIDWADRLTPRLLKIDLNNPVQPWTVFSYTNWGEKPVLVEMDLDRVGLPSGEWILREYWSGETFKVQDQKFEIRLAPHGTVLFAARPWVRDQAIYLGSDLHLSQGMELSGWKSDQTGIVFSLVLNHHAKGIVDIYLPQPPKRITAGDMEVEFQPHAEYIYRLNVEIKGETEYTIEF